MLTILFYEENSIVILNKKVNGFIFKKINILYSII